MNDSKKKFIVTDSEDGTSYDAVYKCKNNGWYESVKLKYGSSYVPDLRGKTALKLTNDGNGNVTLTIKGITIELGVDELCRISDAVEVWHAATGCLKSDITISEVIKNKHTGSDFDSIYSKKKNKK